MPIVGRLPSTVQDRPMPDCVPPKVKELDNTYVLSMTEHSILDRGVIIRNYQEVSNRTVCFGIASRQPHCTDCAFRSLCDSYVSVSNKLFNILN